MVGPARDLRWPDLVWCHFSRPRFGGFDERVAAAAEAGFAGIGLYTEEYRRLRDEEGRSGADIRKQLDDHGLVLAEIESLKGWGGGPDAAQAAQLEETAFEMADEVGARYVQAIGSHAGDVREAA